MKDIELIKHLFIRTYGSQLEGHIMIIIKFSCH